jgi:hypothetical protein
VHVLLDLALGFVPWRAAARCRDKEEVIRWKKQLLSEPAQFLQAIAANPPADFTVDERIRLGSVVSAIESTVDQLIGHLKV